MGNKVSIKKAAFAFILLMGMSALYDVSPVWLVIFSVVMQLVAIPFFWLSDRTHNFAAH